MNTIAKKLAHASLATASALRFGLGTKVMPGVDTFRRPEKMLEMYQKEACPFSRKAREIMTMLDLDCKVYPCPINGRRYRPILEKLGGRQQVPYLVDPNTSVQMYESSHIVQYLLYSYGPGPEKMPYLLSDTGLSTFVSRLSTIARFAPSHGLVRVPSEPPSKAVQYWGFEADLGSRYVREALDSLEVPYVVHNVAQGSLKRLELKKRFGHFTLPILEDENTNTVLFGGEKIVEYLYKTYCLDNDLIEAKQADPSNVAADQI